MNVVTISAPTASVEATDPAFRVKGLCVRYGSNVAVSGVSLDIPTRQITAVIGPSGCGKSTVLRCLNRMNDLVEDAVVEGSILFGDTDVNALDPVELRRRVGMVFQRPNPFPKPIYDNVAFGPRLHGTKRGLDDIVEDALRRAALWDEVRDKLRSPAYSLSGGQQQRLCIARALAVKPEVLLMDEPCSALDPIATTHIEDLMHDLAREVSIVIVTHNMQQAARVAAQTAFFTVEVGDEGRRTGHLVEYAPTSHIFTNPTDPRTEDYVTGRVG